MLKIKIIKEVYTDKQRGYFCSSDDPELKNMCDDPDKEKKIDEMSAAGAGGAPGAPGSNGGPWGDVEEDIEEFNDKQKKDSYLSEDSPLEEMYSTAGRFTGGGGRIPVDEFSGYQERSAHQGLKNVPRPRKKIKIKFNRKKNK